MALHAAAAWAQAAFARKPHQKFAAHAPFYPVCWAFSAFAQGKRQTRNVPTDAFTKWTGVPVKIFAGGKDDYDGQDPEACADFVSHLPLPYQSAFSVQLYAGATHGWDQRSATFFEGLACKGRGCMNHNISDSAMAEPLGVPGRPERPRLVPHTALQQRSMGSIAHYERVSARYAPRLHPPHNEAARRQAGFSDEELAWLTQS